MFSQESKHAVKRVAPVNHFLNRSVPMAKGKIQSFITDDHQELKR
jgi:hypothetical protein